MMSFFALVMAVQWQFESIKSRRMIWLALAILSVIDILFFVQGRTGYVSLAFNVLIFFIFLGSTRLRVMAAMTIIVLTVSAFQYSSHLKSRIDSAITEYQEQDEKKLSSVGQRLEFMKKGVQLIKERPVFGFGTGSYQKEFCRVADTREWCIAGGFHPHNQFIAIGVQMGVVGLLAYLAFLTIAAWQAMKLDNGSKILGVGLVATLVADSIFHAPLFLVAEASFFILALPLFNAIGPSSSQTEQRASIA